jgi:hypothetical protein
MVLTIIAISALVCMGIVLIGNRINKKKGGGNEPR